MLDTDAKKITIETSQSTFVDYDSLKAPSVPGALDAPLQHPDGAAFLSGGLFATAAVVASLLWETIDKWFIQYFS